MLTMSYKLCGKRDDLHTQLTRNTLQLMLVQTITHIDTQTQRERERHIHKHHTHTHTHKHTHTHTNTQQCIVKCYGYRFSSHVLKLDNILTKSSSLSLSFSCLKSGEKAALVSSSDRVVNRGLEERKESGRGSRLLHGKWE